MLFSYTSQDAARAKEFVAPILETEGYHKKYLLSKLILMHCENFVVAEQHFGTWSDQKRDAVIAFFSDSMHHNIEREDENLYLF